MTTENAPSRGNLPAEPNSFVGRERDLEELAQLLSAVRALTLCGPGGIGKTRLALRLAGQMAAGFPDGAWLVELADTADPELLPGRIASALGIREEPDRPLAETLTDALRPRQLLLILDTCEHVVDACAVLVQQLLTGCPRLRLIVTTREPLRVRGETVWRVPPLAVPAATDGLGTGDLAQHEAVRLFAERAAAASPGFALTAENAVAVAGLCRTLDGVPLAIELAAARVRALSIEQIAVRLGDRFQLLATGDRTAPPRQQTLRAAVDWSYGLLTGPEQVLLRRLSVFAGWNLEMAEHVCADEAIPVGQVLDLLAALIDKSLVTLDAELDGYARYRLLDTIKEYAAYRLAASGEGPAIGLRHCDYLLALIEDTVDRAFVRGDPPWPERVAMYRRISVERPNYDAALAACLDRGDAETGLRLCSALRSQWIAEGDVSEGSNWFDRFLGLETEVPARVRARALMLRAEMAFEQQDYATAGTCARVGLDECRRSGGTGATGGLRMLALVSLRAGRPKEALAGLDAAIDAARADGDYWEEGIALSTKAAIIVRQGDLQEAQRTFEDALDVLADNNGWGVAQVRYGLGGLARARGDHAAAADHYASALALYREIGARPDIARCLAGLVWVALAEHDLDHAAARLAESLRLSLATGQRLAIARGIQAAAVLAAQRGETVRTAALEGAALALLDSLGHAPSVSARVRSGQLLDAARRQLGEPAVANLLAEGGAMSVDQAVRYAIGPDNGHAAEAGTAAGQPTAAHPTAGHATAGHATAVQATAVQAPSDGQPTETAHRTAHPTTAREADSGVTVAAGEPVPGQPGAGHPVASHPVPGQPAAAETTSAQSPAGHVAPGPSTAQTTAAQSPSGHAAPGSSAAGHPPAGRPSPGHAAPGGAVGEGPTAAAGSHLPANGSGPGQAAPGGTPPNGAATPGFPFAAAGGPNLASSALTAREREIALLIARGLSNRAIADELVISPATAARHVANIFTKLGLRSRAQVAAWVADPR
jgi:predicted ATPase/DNA-binding CsgD family transcriptional regulator